MPIAELLKLSNDDLFGIGQKTIQSKLRKCDSDSLSRIIRDAQANALQEAAAQLLLQQSDAVRREKTSRIARDTQADASQESATRLSIQRCEVKRREKQLKSEATQVDESLSAANPNLNLVTICGVAIPKQFVKATRGWKRKVAGKWLLENKRGTQVATFATEDELETWWLAFNAHNQKQARPLGLRTKEKRPRAKRKRRRIAQKGKRLSTMTSKSATDFHRPWSTEYDMPEFDSEGFGRMWN